MNVLQKEKGYNFCAIDKIENIWKISTQKYIKKIWNYFWWLFPFCSSIERVQKDSVKWRSGKEVCFCVELIHIMNQRTPSLSLCSIISRIWNFPGTKIYSISILNETYGTVDFACSCSLLYLSIAEGPFVEYVKWMVNWKCTFLCIIFNSLNFISNWNSKMKLVEWIANQMKLTECR